MQMPLGETLTLDLEDAAEAAGMEGEGDGPSKPGSTIQKIVRLNLSEPGQHVLAVTVTYTEHAHAADGSAQGARVRTFRKLYQFVAQPLINVKTKTGDIAATKAGRTRYALEAQLQNLGDRTVCLEVCYAIMVKCVLYMEDADDMAGCERGSYGVVQMEKSELGCLWQANRASNCTDPESK